MVFIVALYAPWCRHMECLKGISPHLYADNLECTSYSVDSLLAAARYLVSCVKVVGQEASPSECFARHLQGCAPAHDSLAK